MTMPAVETRVDRLEEAVDRFIANVGVEFNKLYNSQLRTESELRELKDEMRLYREDTQAFKDEMRLYREDTQAFKDEMRLYREDTQAFKDEMRTFKDETRNDRREMNRKWGDLSNKLGTMVEDLVYPSLARVVGEVFQREVVDLSIRRRRRGPEGQIKEFDAIALTEELVCLNSTKAALRIGDVDAFVADLATFRAYFPEHRSLPLVGILATLAVEESVLSYAERQGFLVLAVGDELMEVKNRPGFVPRRW